MGLCDISVNPSFISVSPIDSDDNNNGVHVFCNRVESEEVLKEIPNEMIADYVNKHMKTFSRHLDIKELLKLAYIK